MFFVCVYYMKFIILLAGFGAAPSSGFGTNFGLSAGTSPFGQTQIRPATTGTTPFSMCQLLIFLSLHGIF